MAQVDLGLVRGPQGAQGIQGPQGERGLQGPKGDTGAGVPAGGSDGYLLVKDGSTNYESEWRKHNNLPAMAAMQDGIAIVADGDNHAAIASGQFVYVKNHSSLAEGLYKARSNIAANAALSTSNLAAEGSGGLNDLQAQVSSLNSNLNAYTAVSFTPESGIETGNFFIRRYGRVICVNGAIIADTAFTANQLLGYIQEGCWPVAAVRVLAGVAAEAYSVGDIAYVAIGNDGGIRITAKSGNTYKSCYFSASYVVQS